MSRNIHSLETPMIQVEGVTKRYGETWALNELSLSIAEGARVSLIGPSGCGKSTLLRVLMGLIVPDRGHVKIEGRAVTRESAQALRQSMGYMVQGGGLFPHLTVLQNVSLVAEYLKWDRPRIAGRYDELARLVHLPGDFRDRFPGELSGGQQQRVALIRALFLDPSLMLLDEPMGALDPLIRAELQEELRAIFVKLKKTVLVVTHDISEAGFLGDEMVLMKHGQVEQRGTLAALVREPSTEFVSSFVNAQRSPLESIG